MALWHEIRGSGGPVVLLHAGGTDARMWDEQFAPLAERFRVLRFDARGFGRSPAGAGSSVEDVVGLMDAVGFERAALVGLSRGARVAVETALAHPERVSAVVAASPMLRGYETSQEVRWFAARDEALMAQGDIEAVIELGHRFWLAGPHRRLEDIDPGLRARLAEMERLARPAPDAPPPDVPLAQIAAPVLAIVGELDIDDVHEHADRLEAEVSGSAKVVVPGAGHMVSLELPDRFTGLVADFLRPRSS